MTTYIVAGSLIVASVLLLGFVLGRASRNGDVMDAEMRRRLG